MLNKNKLLYGLIFIPIAFLAWYLVSFQTNKPSRYLAYFGPKHSNKINDSSYHTIPYFEFTNQFNEKINSNTIKNKIYIAEFFFTTCKSICPKMNSNLKKVYKTYKNNINFLILSHTVYPEIDSVNALLDYSNQYGVTDKKWLFLTGQKKDLYYLARKGYLLNNETGNADENDFIHTQNIALIDTERHIRGFYDATDSLEIIRLIQEINLLQAEYDYKNINTIH